jgi:radical SAM protein with 4Fe4S-binding SPASM domain
VLNAGGNCILNLVVGRENLDDVEQSISALLDLGVAGITVSSAVGSIEGENLNDNHSIDPLEYAELVWKLRRTPGNVGFLHELPLCLYPPDRFIELIRLKKLGYGCHIGIGNGLSVNPQGVTIPCNSMYNLPMIGLFEDGRLKYTAEEFLDMWQTNKELLELRDMANVYRSEWCQACQLWDVCNSGCPLTWANLEPDDYINPGLIDIDLSVFSTAKQEGGNP